MRPFTAHAGSLREESEESWMILIPHILRVQLLPKASATISLTGERPRQLRAIKVKDEP